MIVSECSYLASVVVACRGMLTSSSGSNLVILELVLGALG